MTRCSAVTLVVWKLDRLGRSVKHLVNLVVELETQGVQFKRGGSGKPNTGEGGGLFVKRLVNDAGMQSVLAPAK